MEHALTQPQTSWTQSWGQVPLRIVLGIVFMMHGWQKLFDFGVAGTADILGKLGIPLATAAAVLLIVVELAGGMAILIGSFARTAALLLAIEMCVAIPVARFGGGFFTPYGYEFEMTLLGACLTLAAIGPGGVSADTWWRRRSAAPG
jgi:putative oxidoreductase